MAGEEVYVARLGAWVARALGETSGFASELDTEGLGFQMPEAIVTDGGVAAAGRALGDAGATLQAGADALEAAVASGDHGELASALLQLVEGIYLFVDALVALVTRIETRAASLGASERDAVIAFCGQMTRKTIDYLVITLLEQNQPRLAFLLKLLGLIDWRVVEPTSGLNATRHVRKDLRLERIKDLITDPAAHFSSVYGWGTNSFDPGEILDSVRDFYPEESSIEYGKVGDDAYLQIGPFRWGRDGSVSPPGLALDISAQISQRFDERIEFDEEWGTDFSAELALSGGAVFRLRPPFELSAEPKAGTLSGATSFVVNRNSSARGFTILGGNDLLRLDAEDVGVGAELTLGASTTGAVSIDPGVFAELKGLTLSLGSEGSDNFLASLLAEADVEGVFDLGLGWKLSEGLVIRAAGGLEIAIPMHQSLGFATLETLYLILKIREDASFALEVSAGITGQLGPLTAAVERMGVELTLGFSSGADAELGPVDLALAFKPPNGVGLALDAGVVRGGGYLYLDYEKGEYAGALELVFSEIIAVKAIGLISTKMPDGSDGFSLLIVVTAEFGTPIQLGFGFTLVGLGGLLGLNRTMLLEELAEGVRTGAVENVMFPTDVIANAPRILSDMKRFFPVEEETFLIGPMAKLGWGTPTLITASLGVVIEVPPGNIAILGVLKCALPDEEAALLVLQVNFIGAIEVDKSRLWFFASLYGSRVLFITIGGEMGLLIAWGDAADFVLSVGGFHPKFSPPPLPFPSPERVYLSILDESFARIRVEGYFAVTTNTAQFGAAVELFFGVSDFSIEGHLGFDALFQFSPFYFIITFSASMSVKVFGAGLFSVRIRGELEGTSPWHVEGEGSISVLFFDIDVPFSHTWGESADTVLPSIEALPVLQRELEKRENWLGIPPASAHLSVSLRTIDVTEELVLHPVGSLQVSQRAVPLELLIDKIGNQPVSDIEQATLRGAGTDLVKTADVREKFARGQFVELDTDARVSEAGTADYKAGAKFSVSGGDARSSHAVKRVVLHELVVIDSNYKEHARRLFDAGLAWFTSLFASNATARSTLSKARRTAQVPFEEKIVVNGPGFVIAHTSDNSAASETLVFSSQAEARDALRAQAKTDPRRAASLHVIPAAETRRAA